MFINFSKKEIMILSIFNFILSLLFLYFSFYMHSFVMYGLDSGTLPFYYNLISQIGRFLSGYFLLITFILPEKVAISFIGGILGYISGFIMTVPVTLILVYLYKKIANYRTAPSHKRSKVA